MTPKVALDPDAAAELETAAVWYDDQRPGLGLQFLAAADRTIQQAVRWPDTGTLVDDLPSDLLVRRLPVSGFPYHVAYLLDKDSLHVLAVPHDHRRPGYWKQMQCGVHAWKSRHLPHRRDIRAANLKSSSGRS